MRCLDSKVESVEGWLRKGGVLVENGPVDAARRRGVRMALSITKMEGLPRAKGVGQVVAG
jgi:hypothetical protein